MLISSLLHIHLFIGVIRTGWHRIAPVRRNELVDVTVLCQTAKVFQGLMDTLSQSYPLTFGVVEGFLYVAK